MDKYDKKFRDDSSFQVGGNSKSTTFLIGAFVVLAGFFILLRRMGVPIPHWLISWEMILIVVGLVMGIRSGFRDISWVFPLVIGLIFISDDVFPGFRFGNLIWPIAIMAIGFLILTRGTRSHSKFMDWSDNKNAVQEPIVSGFKREDELDSPVYDTYAKGPDDEIELTAIFGSVKRTVVSKNFKGGEAVAIFGGADIDLTHADINGIVKLEATNIFGGTKLIVPPTWDVQSEMVAVFGGVEDKRRIQPELINRNKRLVLLGTAFLGGLEIRSF
jgi:hypothetical protein